MNFDANNTTMKPYYDEDLDTQDGHTIAALVIIVIISIIHQLLLS